LGNLTLHGSHSLTKMRGIVWCWKCGVYGITAPRKLAKRCEPPTQGGVDCLRRIRKGLTPRAGLEWPEPLP
jgi:hypothetical protein